MNWDDVRLFLAVVRNGTTRSAAQKLSIHQSTVSRRLKQLERETGVQLFDRRGSGLVLTEEGNMTLQVALRIEGDFALLSRQALGRDSTLDGRIRVSLPDFMVVPLAPLAAEFGRRHPGITLELAVDNGYVSLTHREADIALRLGTSAPDHLVGRRIASAPAAVYATPDYLKQQADPSNLPALDWLRWEEAWRAIPPERWIADHIDPAQVRARVNTSFAHAELIAAGLGVGFLLCYTADGDSRLCRISEPFDFGLSIWLLTHEDLRNAGRIAAFMSYLGDALMEQRHLIEAR